MQMKKSLDSRDNGVNQHIKKALEDLQSVLSNAALKKISPILDSLLGDFEGIKNWLEDFETT